MGDQGMQPWGQEAIGTHLVGHAGGGGEGSVLSREAVVGRAAARHGGAAAARGGVCAGKRNGADGLHGPCPSPSEPTLPLTAAHCPLRAKSPLGTVGTELLCKRGEGS